MEIGIPGQTSSSGIDTKQVIQDLVEAERKPIERLENQIDEADKKNILWAELGRDLDLFGDYAKKLYSFDNPFDIRSAQSSNERVLTADTIRGTEYGEYDVTVKQVASADRWVSDSLSQDYEVAAGNYIFNVGDNQISFDYEGGNLEDFAKTLKEEGENYITARVVQRGTEKNSATFLLESLVEGKKNSLSLEAAALNFSKKIGLQAKASSKNTKNISIAKKDISQILSADNLINQQGSQLQLLPGAIAEIKTNVSIEQSQSAQLELSIVAKNTTQSDNTESLADLSENIKASLEDVSVLGITKTDILNIDNTQLDNLALLLPSVSDTAGVVIEKKESQVSIGDEFTISVDLDKIYDKTSGLIHFTLTNPFPGYDLFVKESQISEKNSNNGLVPKNPLSVAQNTILEFNGVEFERETKDVDDIIPGVTLHAKRESEEPVLISINADFEIIKEDIINFVGSYNQIMRKIRLFTSTREDVLDEMGYDNSDDREEAKKNILGKLSGTVSLISLENRLQSIMGKQYSNKSDVTVKFLRDIGIAPNISGSASSNSSSRYLDIDEAKLDASLENNLDEVADLFGSDINNDIIIDFGVAFSASEGIKSFTQTGGIIDQKRNSASAQIERDRKQVTKYNDKLVNYESDLKRKFGAMERALSKLDDVTNSLNNLSGNNK